MLLNALGKYYKNPIFNIQPKESNPKEAIHQPKHTNTFPHTDKRTHLYIKKYVRAYFFVFCYCHIHNLSYICGGYLPTFEQKQSNI